MMWGALAKLWHTPHSNCLLDTRSLFGVATLHRGGALALGFCLQHCILKILALGLLKASLEGRSMAVFCMREDLFQLHLGLLWILLHHSSFAHYRMGRAKAKALFITSFLSLAPAYLSKRCYH